MKYYGKITDDLDLIHGKQAKVIIEQETAEGGHIHNVPAGGTEGQALIKNSGTDYDLKWGNVSGDVSNKADKVAGATSGNLAGLDASGNLTDSGYNSSSFTKPSDVVDNVITTTTNVPLSANQGKLLNDRINNLESMGRYLALWDCTTGKPTTNPTTMPYTYRAGDYYRVATVGTTNYKPDGSTYNDVASTVVETGNVAVGDVYFYDGTTWSLQINHIGGLVTDVQVDGTSVVSGGIANINKEIYWCTYDTTTSSQINTALSEGKLVYCNYNNIIYTYYGIASSRHVFTAVSQTASKNLLCKIANSTWSTTSTTFEKTNNKVTSISSSSTDTQYPSAKCVYDELLIKQNAPTVIIGTLTAGETTLILTNSVITTDSIIDVYTGTYGISPTNVVASTGSVTLTFKVQAADLAVRVEVR